MSSSNLGQPVAVLARAAMPLSAEDSLFLAVRRLRESGVGILPITSEGRYLGAITERSAAEALSNGGEELAPASIALDRRDATIAPYATGAEALRLFQELQISALVVVDDAGRVFGTLAPSDLYPRELPLPRPPMIGGMATPFGVYLTTGTVRAGASDLALVTTGMLLCVLLLTSAVVASYAMLFLINHHVADSVVDLLGSVTLFAVFGVFMRAIPLSKIHAAEHMTVHAIERGEPLVLSVVKRMPRVHPRCGTNLAVGAILFLSLATSDIIPDQTIKLLVALVATLTLWRTLGSIVQKFVTTAPPKQKHVEMGIRAGRELIEKYVHAPIVMPNLGQRIYNSGMLHVVAGSTICSLVAVFAARALHVQIPGGII